ncbi:hypothetical protein OOJ09_19200 [Mesorhizobium qingshengii]|uniref:Uncharacterized protein n=1 Tax=Mesorhizobium qingshengii TaxID=1165689 RepID=A0ABT4QXL0_9HYPH|nr:hypothetical protein [Mesorhizobium qingshengii]MCZ8546321.1 hypothetical protein [Mesorhizobium qingshengii]
MSGDEAYTGQWISRAGFPRWSKDQLEAVGAARLRLPTSKVEDQLKYPAHFSAEAVDRIVAAVASSKSAAVRLDRSKLRHKLDRALFWYGIFEAFSGLRGPYRTLGKRRWHKLPPAQRPLRWLLNPHGPESATEWLVGEHLAKIFARHFGMRATARQYQTVRKGGEIHPGKLSPYVVFVLAVLEEAEIRKGNSDPITVETIIAYRKKALRTKGLK